MAIAQSRLTAQGQISVPSEIRRRPGLAPGSVIEWDDENGSVVVRRASGSTWDDINRALFADAPPPARTLDEMKAGIRNHVKKKHASRR
jgi:AbrB family looped-hinge helix DNA binding protein